MENLTATEAARRFSELLDAVEYRRQTFVIVRRGRPIARIEPAQRATGAVLKRILRDHPPDSAWSRELGELREALTLEERSWRE